MIPGKFTNLDLRAIDDRPGWWLVLADVGYVGTFQYTVKQGSETDLASIPRVFRWALSRTGPSRKPAVFHDDMYGKQWKTRKECDEAFREMLLSRGVSKFTAWIYYRGVRAFGWTRGNW